MMKTGVTEITDYNRFWQVADHSIASNALVKAKTTPAEWSYWNWDNSKYVFGKTITENGTQSIYYICANGTELRLTTDGGTPSASTTNKRVFEHVSGANGIYTFKLLNSELYAGLKYRKLKLVEKESATP